MVRILLFMLLLLTSCSSSSTPPTQIAQPPLDCSSTKPIPTLPPNPAPTPTTRVIIPPNDLVSSVYLASEQRQAQFQIQLQKYRITGMRASDTNAIDALNPQIIYIDCDEVMNVNPAWLQKQYKRGILIVGVDVTHGQLTALLNQSSVVITPQPPIAPMGGAGIPEYPIEPNQLIMSYRLEIRKLRCSTSGGGSTPVPEFDQIIALMLDRYHQSQGC